MTIILATFIGLTGAVWVTPGALPVAANAMVYIGRMAAGAGMIVCSLSLFMRLEDLLHSGLFIITAGLAATAFAIYRQSCAPKE